MAACLTKSGSRTAAVPKMMRETPCSTQIRRDLHIPDAAAQLDRDRNGPQNLGHGGPVDRFALKGAVQIYDMDPGKALRLESRPLRPRIGVEHGWPRPFRPV